MSEKDVVVVYSVVSQSFQRTRYYVRDIQPRNGRRIAVSRFLTMPTAGSVSTLRLGILNRGALGLGTAAGRETAAGRTG